jgi:hypothetical protein
MTLTLTCLLFLGPKDGPKKPSSANAMTKKRRKANGAIIKKATGITTTKKSANVVAKQSDPGIF